MPLALHSNSSSNSENAAFHQHLQNAGDNEDLQFTTAVAVMLRLIGTGIAPQPPLDCELRLLWGTVQKFAAKLISNHAWFHQPSRNEELLSASA
jgi:hypothetical protein